MRSHGLARAAAAITAATLCVAVLATAPAHAAPAGPARAGDGAASQPPSNSSVCDLYAYYGTPCGAAYSMTRAMYASYDGPLYQVTRASDNTTHDIGLLAPGGDVNASEQDSFCANTTCTITEIYDQSPDGNNLTVEGPGGNGGQDK